MLGINTGVDFQRWRCQSGRGAGLQSRCFEQAIASEGCIIHVLGHEDVPFAPSEVAEVRVNHKRWNFREWSDSRYRGGKSRVATA